MERQSRRSRVLLDKLVAMVTPETLGTKHNFCYAPWVNIKGHKVSASCSEVFQHSDKNIGGGGGGEGNTVKTRELEPTIFGVSLTWFLTDMANK